MTAEARPENTAHADSLPRAVDWQNPRVVQILDAASRCFARKGFAAATMKDIADEAGITKSMIHYYFESKQALILELLAFAFEKYYRRVRERLASVGGDTPERAVSALGEAFRVVQDKQELRLNLELLAAASRDPAVNKRMIVLQERTRAVITEAVLDVLGSEKDRLPIPPEVLGALIHGVLHGLRVQWLVDGDEQTAQSAFDVFVALLLHAFQTVVRAGAGNGEKPAEGSK